MSHITITTPDGLKLEFKPAQLLIELDNDSITVRLADNIALLSGFNLLEDTHGEYAEWAEWDGCRFATLADKKAFQAAIESAVERHCARAQHPGTA